MTRYTIEQPSTGAILGTYEGETPTDALAAMYRDAGYSVRVEGGELVGVPDSLDLDSLDVREA